MWGLLAHLNSCNILDIASLTSGVVIARHLWTVTCQYYELHREIRDAAFSREEMRALREMYGCLVGEMVCTVSFIPEIHTEFEYVEISGERIGSRLSRQQRSSFIIASWVGAAGSVDMSSEDSPGRVDN